MSIKQRLDEDMKQALRERDTPRLDCIRMLKSKMLEREVALRGQHGKDYSIDDDEALAVLASYAKQRRESIEAYRQAGRDGLADAEQAELAIVTAYLPAQLGEDEIREIVREAITSSGISSPKDMGRLMGLVMPKFKGTADGKLVRRIVQELLAG